MQKAVLRLFNAVHIEKQGDVHVSQTVLQRTIKNGYVLEFGLKPEQSLLDTIESVVGLSGERANSTFHKSWEVVQSASIESLVLQQIIHYITTYGFEAAGIYQQESVYIPAEALEIPALKGGIRLVLIKALSHEDLLENILRLGSGIALSEETLKDILEIVQACDFDAAIIQQIGNHELKSLLYDHYELVPQEPLDYLRYLIRKLADETLLIKNDQLIEKIKASDGAILDRLLDDAPIELASIFYRYKPLFLALKSISSDKTFFNKLRKQAPKLHRPLESDTLSSATAQLKHSTLNLVELQESLAGASLFRKIRLAYALHNRLNSRESIVYRVRNGRGWATDFNWPNYLSGATSDAFSIVKESIVMDLKPKLEGKTVFIPRHMHYALPATEKQFTGNFPTGTSIATPEDLIVGVHWFNTDKRIDLDLAVIGASGKIGWDSNYRSAERDVLFSGDMTDAPFPQGATELFYLKKSADEPKILTLNFFNHDKGDEVDAKIIVASEKPENFGRNYMVDPNSILASANIKVMQKQSILGLITQGRVYFSHMSLGTSISSHNDEHSTHARNFLVASLLESIDLKEILFSAGAIVNDRKEGDEDFDLSPESINKQTFLNLLR